MPCASGRGAQSFRASAARLPVPRHCQGREQAEGGGWKRGLVGPPAAPALFRTCSRCRQKARDGTATQHAPALRDLFVLPKDSKPTALGCREAPASLGWVRLAPQVLAGISSAPACRCLSRHWARCRGNRHGTVLKSERRSRQRKEVRGAGSRGTLFRWCLVRYFASHCGPLEEPLSCSGAL